jgi:hypothetical protein
MVQSERTTEHPPARLTSELIREALGDIDDAMTAAIIDTEATLQDFEEAVAWATGESDVMGESGHDLEGVAADIYDILTAYDDEEDVPHE